MVTFAQNFEDVILRRALQDVERGFYVDIGAFHPVVDSVTHWFYGQGWRGINVEPNPRFYAILAEQRPDDLNLPVAVAGRAGAVRLTLLDGLSTIVPAHAAAHGEAGHDVGRVSEVRAITLGELFASHVGDRTVDFLKLDVEGAEEAIITGNRFDEVRPRILVIEATLPNSSEESWAGWEPTLLASGYSFALFDGLNRFYLREEDRWRMPWLAAPANVHDRFVLRRDDFRVSPDGEVHTVGGLMAELEAARHERDELRADVAAIGRVRGLVAELAPAALNEAELARALSALRKAEETTAELRLQLMRATVDAGSSERLSRELDLQQRRFVACEEERQRLSHDLERATIALARAEIKLRS